MKKITALLLALCMLLAAAPVLGEESPAGNWYMSLADVTLGYILLNEDGTAIVNVASEARTAASSRPLRRPRTSPWILPLKKVPFPALCSPFP